MTSAPIIMDFFGEQLADVETAWSVGTFGAIAEFMRDADEMATLAHADGMISVLACCGRSGLPILEKCARSP